MRRGTPQHIVEALLIALFLLACDGRKPKPRPSVDPQQTEAQEKHHPPDSATLLLDAHPKSPTALRLDSLGLVDVSDMDSSIVVSLLYATPDNFVGEILYADLTEAYLHPEAAEALIKARRLLKEQHPHYTLIVYDATRPMSVQQKMWDLVKGTPQSIYVSNSSRGGGLHNYGLAVDLSIFDTRVGKPLSMGTEIDHFDYQAHITDEAGLVKKGFITPHEKENRELLRRVMRGAGFRTLPSEWWHFNLHSREVAGKKYKLIE